MGREERVSPSVIAHGNSAPVLEPTKHDFNFVPLLIEVFIIKDRLFPVLLGGMHGVMPLLSNASRNQVAS